MASEEEKLKEALIAKLSQLQTTDMEIISRVVHELLAMPPLPSSLLLLQDDSLSQFVAFGLGHVSSGVRVFALGFVFLFFCFFVFCFFVFFFLVIVFSFFFDKVFFFLFFLLLSSPQNRRKNSERNSCNQRKRRNQKEHGISSQKWLGSEIC